MTHNDVRHESNPTGDAAGTRTPIERVNDLVLGHKRSLARGYSDAMSRGVELAALPVVFGLLGWLVDRAAGTSPVFLLGFVLFAFAGMLVRMWLGYDAEMRRHEAALPGARPASTRPTARRSDTDRADRTGRGAAA